MDLDFEKLSLFKDCELIPSVRRLLINYRINKRLVIIEDDYKNKIKKIIFEELKKEEN